MDLDNVSRGQLNLPWRIVVYGVEGVGKTTLGTDADHPIVLGPEAGTSHMAHVTRAPKPRNWKDVLDFLQQLLAREHPYKTLVVDSLDWLEPLIWDAVCKQAKVDKIEKVDGGYGKGYVAAVDDWREFLHKLDELREAKGMQIILIAHSQIKRTPNPDGSDFERYQLAINPKAADLVKQWADLVLFARFKTATAQIDNRIKGVDAGTAKRVLHTEHRATFDAKNRVGLPPEIPLDYTELMRLISAGVSAEEMRSKIERLLPQVDATTRAKARDSIAAVGNDGTKLAQILNLVMNKVGSENGNITKEREQ
jgi:hypothetical protein